MRTRIDATRLVVPEETDTTCCHAIQDELWLHFPDGMQWEFWMITDDNPASALNVASEPAEGACCT